MRIATLAALLLAILPAAAVAADVGGTYSVTGTNLDGSPYEGTARINAKSATACEIIWTTGKTETRGTCMLNGDAFAAAYALGEKAGLIIYKVKPDGVLNGVWTLADTNGSGTETLTPVR